MVKYEKNGNLSYCLGAQASFTLLEVSPSLAKRLYISPRQKRDDTYSRLLDLAHANRVPVIENNERIFKDLSGKDNVMVIGEFSKVETPLDPDANHVVLINPSNMGNLGTIMRCLVGFGIEDLAIITPAADPFDPKVIRASMGAVFHLRMQRFSSFEEYKKAINPRSFFPFMLQAKTLLGEQKKAEKWSLIFGNEATGLPEEFLQVGEPLLIKQTQKIDSLNLDNAVAIGLYEFMK